MTHINAFQGNVEEKKLALTQAQSELDEAQRLLEAHPDYEAPKKEKKEEPEEAPAEVKQEKGSKLWKK